MRRGRAAAYPYVLWMALFVVVPIILVVVFAFTSTAGELTLANFARMSDYTVVFRRSIILALAATVICLLIGYPVAYVLTGAGESMRRFSMMLIMLPMWINFLLRTYAWMSILERLNLINTQGAVVLGMVYNYLPFMILPIYSVILKIDRSVIEAAQDLGAGSIQTFARVILPLSLSGVVSGVTMVFVPSVSTFIISRLLGGGTEMLLGDLIEMQFLGNAYNPNLGAAISLIMMMIVMVCMSLMNRFGEGEEQAVIL